MRSIRITWPCAPWILLLLCVMSAYAAGQSAPAEMRYKLSPGDRLVYREGFEREGKSPDTTFHTRVVFSSQVVVLDAAAGRSMVGVQRNRLSAELLEYHERGKDTLALQKPEFAQRMAKPPVHFADFNLFSATGEELMPQQVLREANSKLLYRIAEIMPLPLAPVQVGSEWDPGMFGLQMKLERFEQVGEQSCAVFSGTGARNETHLHFTFCPGSGYLAKLEFDGQYLELDTTIHESVTLELQDSRHGEAPTAWLADPETQLGALTAYLGSVLPLPDTPIMDALLKNGSSEVQALALAAYYQRRLTPDQEALPPLLQSKDAEVRRIANRFQAPPAKPESQPCDVPPVAHGREKWGTTLRSINGPAFANVPYIIHVPLDYRGDQPFPLIVYLSGGGGLAFDGALTAEQAVGHTGYLAIYPNARGAMWWDAKTTEMVHTLLLEVLQTYNVDTNRVYLAGFSNGGTAALEFGARWPDRFAAIASLMGAGMNSPSGVKLPMRNLLDVPVLFLHGDKDERIPSSASSETFNALRSLKPVVPPELHILKGRSHEVTLDADDGYTLPFFERFTRNPFPALVSAKIWDLRFPRQYWMEVVEGDKATAEVEGQILADNVVEIKTRNVKKLRLFLRPELFRSAGPVRVRLNGKQQAAIELKRDCQLFLRSNQTYSDPYLAYTDEIVLDVP